MTAVHALVSPRRLSALGTEPPRLAIFDGSVLTSDIIAATRRGRPSSFVTAMRHGTLRAFITNRVWAVIPRVLEDRWNEGEKFDLAAAERMWWHTYIPLLRTVCTDGLPFTAQADRLTREDLTDVGMVQLHAVLGPAALVSQDGDLTRTGLVRRDWAQVRAAVGKVESAELQARVARVLACAPEPMTRTRILTAVPEFPGRTHRDRMYRLYELLRTYPMFCEITPHRWQVGRTHVGARLIEAPLIGG